MGLVQCSFVIQLHPKQKCFHGSCTHSCLSVAPHVEKRFAMIRPAATESLGTETRIWELVVPTFLRPIDTTVLRPFFPGLPGWAGARRNLLLDFMVQGKITWGRHTDHPAWRHYIWTNQRPTSIIPPFLRRMPHPSYFILDWDRHQICWLAYPVA